MPVSEHFGGVFVHHGAAKCSRPLQEDALVRVGAPTSQACSFYAGVNATVELEPPREAWNAQAASAFWGLKAVEAARLLCLPRRSATF